MLTPEAYLAHAVERGADPDGLAIGDVAVLAWGPLAADLARAVGARRRRNWVLDARWPRYELPDAPGASLFGLPTGAPAAAMLLELVIACGVRAVLGLGLAGSLDPAMCPGEMVVASAALGGDGTSSHYLPPRDGAGATLIRPAARLLEDLNTDAVAATVWTTDAPFRALPADIARWRREGARLTDMETAALYAVAATHARDIAMVLVVSDQVGNGWSAPASDEPLRSGCDAACAALLETAAREGSRWRNARTT